MNAYHYNELRFFDCEIDCQIDPLESKAAGHDVYLMPADATDKKPTKQDGFTPRWNGTAWEQYADDAIVYGYTENADGTINYYGEAHTEEELAARNTGVDLLYTDTKPVTVNGIYWLSADDPAYIVAKKAADKQAALDALDNEYRAEKANLCEAYTTASMQGDTETAQSVAQDMVDLDAWYDEVYKAIEEGSENNG